MQEDLEAEFQSLFSLLEELKEGMLMKIKQDRASRTYELQVCVSGGLSKTPDAISTAPLSSQLASCLFPNLPLFPCPFFPVSRARHPDDAGLAASFPGLLPAPSLAMTCQPPTRLFSLLIPCSFRPLLAIATATPPQLVPPSCSHPVTRFSALPTGPPDLMAKHPPWLLWDWWGCIETSWATS